MRAFLAAVAGFLVAFVVVTVVETAGALVVPPPAGIDSADPAVVAAALEQVPPGAMAFVLVAWLLAPLAGCAVATVLGKERGRLAAGVVAALFVAACVANLLAIPSPWWLWLGGTVGAPAAALAGLVLVERRNAARSRAVS